MSYEDWKRQTEPVLSGWLFGKKCPGYPSEDGPEIPLSTVITYVVPDIFYLNLRCPVNSSWGCGLGCRFS